MERTSLELSQLNETNLRLATHSGATYIPYLHFSSVVRGMKYENI